MIRQFTRLTFSAAVIGALTLLVPQAARGRQVGVKAEPPAKAPMKKSPPPRTATKPPVVMRPMPQPPRSKVDEPFISTYPVLSLIEKFKAPPYPKSEQLSRETYDYRLLHKVPVPATLTDVLICDLWQRAIQDLKLSPSPKAVSEEAVKQAMNVYLTKNWIHIAGYRPWTHWNFIRGLDETGRATLAKDVARYIQKNGVRDVKK